MKKILYINACVRKKSRTNELARYALGFENAKITELRLDESKILPLDSVRLCEREALIKKGDFSHPSFEFAKQFATADEIVIAAPYWDLSFPALLKTYFEQICVTGITFYYAENGEIKSPCAAKKLTYVTTAGGFIFEPNMGFEYIKQLSETFFGITCFEYYKAEGLDIIGADTVKIMNDAKEKIKN